MLGSRLVANLVKSSPVSSPAISKPSLVAKPADRPIKKPIFIISNPPLEIILEESAAEFESTLLETTEDNTGKVAKVLKEPRFV